MCHLTGLSNVKQRAAGVKTIPRRGRQSAHEALPESRASTLGQRGEGAGEGVRVDVRSTLGDARRRRFTRRPSTGRPGAPRGVLAYVTRSAAPLSVLLLQCVASAVRKRVNL